MDVKMHVDLKRDQREQLVGWLKREKDFLLSIVSMSKRINIPRVTGSHTAVKADLEFVYRVWEACNEQHSLVKLTVEDADILVDIAGANTYEDREDFWRGVRQTITASFAE